MTDSRPARFMDPLPEVADHRRASYDPDPLFLNRWSPRSMTGEPLAEEALFSLFEAARWAPSSRNAQPWRFNYATRDGPHWSTFFGLLNEHNQSWAGDAAVLVLISSKTTHEDGSPNGTHSFDTGAAWENFFLEGVRRGIVVHGIGGFDHEAARTELSVPDELSLEAMAAVGHPVAPEERREQERPNGREPLDAFVTAGGF